MEQLSYEDQLRSIRDKALEFDKHLVRVKKYNDDLVQKSERVLHSVTELLGSAKPTAKKNCAVCYTRERTHAVLPCGHVFCENCAQRAARGRCFNCRQPIQETIRVYV